MHSPSLKYIASKALQALRYDYSKIPLHKWKQLSINSLHLYQYILHVVFEEHERIKHNEITFSIKELGDTFPKPKNMAAIVRLLDELEEMELIHRIRYVYRSANICRSENVVLTILAQYQHKDFVSMWGRPKDNLLKGDEC